MKTTRRRFLSVTATAAASFTIIPRHVLGGPRFVPPSEKVNVALIGAGGQGRENVRALMRLPDVQVMAVADPVGAVSLDEFYFKGKGAREPVRAEIEKHYGEKMPNFRCAAHEDFRVMLEKEKGIDAVLCATPDHLHAYVSLVSMRAGKHVYCEKPLTHNLAEARLVARVAQETGVATQMGNQGHSNEGIRDTCEWIWSGAIGPVREVHSWVRTSRWNPALAGRPSGTPAVPADVNWDLWLGPRPSRPYHPAYLPVRWRDFWAFGGGALGDFGCHDLDAAFWALDLREPLTVETRAAGPMNADITPHGEICYFHFGARKDQPPVKVIWHDGGLMPATPPEMEDEPLPARGSLFFGDKGVLLCGGAGGKPRLVPDSKMDDFKRPEKTLVRSKGHHRDWIDACKGGPPASSNFGYGAALTELPLLGILALRLGKKIEWDAASFKVKNAPEADAFIQGEYRAGWELPA